MPLSQLSECDNCGAPGVDCAAGRRVDTQRYAGPLRMTGCRVPVHGGDGIALHCFRQVVHYSGPHQGKGFDVVAFREARI